jgi:predicted porin
MKTIVTRAARRIPRTVLRERCEWPFARDAVEVYVRRLLTIESFRVNKDSNMQRSLIALAVLATLGTSAFAQSNVTLYGRVNVTVERQKVGNGPNNWVEQNNASRFGLKGSEDLGGGLKAGFVLEHRFNINDGRPTYGTAFWGGAGQAEVNLGSSQFGTIRMGHMTSEAYYATADYVSMHNHDTGTSSDALYAFVDNSSNKVAYRSPSLGGLTLDAAVSSGDSPNTRRSYDFAGNYDAGPLHLGAGYTKQKDSDAKQFAARALYELGPFVFGGYVQRDTDGYGSGYGNRTTYRLSGMYTMASTEFHLNFGHAGDYGARAGDNKASQYTLAVNQNLSKRTKVYAFYTRINNSSGATYSFGPSVSGGQDLSSFAVGVRHNF